MDDETPRCAFCKKKVDFVDVAAIDMRMLRGQVIDEDHDEDDETWTYGLLRAFCSEEHFREWSREPLPDVKTWDWTPSEDDLSAGCALVLLIGGLLIAAVLGLAVYGTIQAIQTIT